MSEAETVKAVDEVDLVAHRGEFIGLFGHSGSGKTTLLNLLAGLDMASSGELVVAGLQLRGASEERRIELRRESIGMVHQSDYLIEEFTALENVCLPLEARGIRGKVAEEEAGELLSRVGLEGYRDRLPRQLSGGQRQRVGIARALTGGRQILLADEPTGALDSANSEAIFELLRGLCDEGRLVVVASHDPACRRHATRVISMLDGRIATDVDDVADDLVTC
ncbi:ABC transporter ATP-binding protein [Nocardioides malaquae]|uniref:ABC transporter ATP-binding protein n=1 Tax=Nocardioides malaquae TaxID=2773426 RepID=UPI0029D41D70|nr:ABC transporter ATP-binding protein [Nocardioides malaquae]